MHQYSGLSNDHKPQGNLQPIQIIEGSGSFTSDLSSRVKRGISFQAIIEIHPLRIY